MRKALKYKVSIENNEYIADVEPVITDDSTPIADTGGEVSFEVVQNEYHHCFDRSSKLDNKVYILLTVCAFLFVMLLEAIKKIGGIEVPANRLQFIFDAGYFVLIAIIIVVFGSLLARLIILLQGVELKHFDSAEVLEKNMIQAEKKRVIKYICMYYEQCRDYNNNLIETQYIKFNYCVRLLIANVALLLFASIYGSLL